MRQFLKDNPELTEEIENKVKAEFGLIDPVDQFAEDGSAESSESAAEGDAKADSKDAKAAKTAGKA